MSRNQAKINSGRRNIMTLSPRSQPGWRRHNLLQPMAVGVVALSRIVCSGVTGGPVVDVLFSNVGWYYARSQMIFLTWTVYRRFLRHYAPPSRGGVINDDAAGDEAYNDADSKRRKAMVAYGEGSICIVLYLLIYSASLIFVGLFDGKPYGALNG